MAACEGQRASFIARQPAARRAAWEAAAAGVVARPQARLRAGGAGGAAGERAGRVGAAGRGTAGGTRRALRTGWRGRVARSLAAVAAQLGAAAGGGAARVHGLRQRLRPGRGQRRRQKEGSPPEAAAAAGARARVAAAGERRAACGVAPLRAALLLGAASARNARFMPARRAHVHGHNRAARLRFDEVLPAACGLRLVATRRPNDDDRDGARRAGRVAAARAAGVVAPGQAARAGGEAGGGGGNVGSVVRVAPAWTHVTARQARRARRRTAAVRDEGGEVGGGAHVGVHRRVDGAREAEGRAHQALRLQNVQHLRTR